MTLRAAALSLVCLVPTTLAADPIEQVFDLLAVPEMVEIMRSEGLDYGRELAADMRPGGADRGWETTLAAIYNPDAMQDTVEAGMLSVLQGQDVTPIIAFFEGDLGTSIVELELSARMAMVDEDIDTAARDVFRGLDGSDDARLLQLERFVEANDLIETNVIGNLNSAIQFYFGMAAGGALELSEGEILQIVWQSEPETRDETVEWVYSFLLMAYAPLDPADIDRYIAFSETEAGQMMNRALFAGYNAMFDEISYALGLALATDMEVRDL